MVPHPTGRHRTPTSRRACCGGSDVAVHATFRRHAAAAGAFFMQPALAHEQSGRAFGRAWCALRFGSVYDWEIVLSSSRLPIPTELSCGVRLWKIYSQSYLSHTTDLETYSRAARILVLFISTFRACSCISKDGRSDIQRESTNIEQHTDSNTQRTAPTLKKARKPKHVRGIVLLVCDYSF